MVNDLSDPRLKQRPLASRLRGRCRVAEDEARAPSCKALYQVLKGPSVSPGQSMPWGSINIVHQGYGNRDSR